jgi:hypothetical protein
MFSLMRYRPGRSGGQKVEDKKDGAKAASDGAKTLASDAETSMPLSASLLSKSITPRKDITQTIVPTASSLPTSPVTKRTSVVETKNDRNEQQATKVVKDNDRLDLAEVANNSFLRFEDEIMKKLQDMLLVLNNEVSAKTVLSHDVKRLIIKLEKEKATQEADKSAGRSSGLDNPALDTKLEERRNLSRNVKFAIDELNAAIIGINMIASGKVRITPNAVTAAVMRASDITGLSKKAKEALDEDSFIEWMVDCYNKLVTAIRPSFDKQKKFEEEQKKIELNNLSTAAKILCNDRKKLADEYGSCTTNWQNEHEKMDLYKEGSPDYLNAKKRVSEIEGNLVLIRRNLDNCVNQCKGIEEQIKDAEDAISKFGLRECLSEMARARYGKEGIEGSFFSDEEEASADYGISAKELEDLALLSS